MDGQVAGIIQAPGQGGGQVGVQLHGDDPSGAGRQAPGEDAGAGADFQYGVGRDGVGGGHNAVGEGGVGEEVLAEGLAGAAARGICRWRRRCRRGRGSKQSWRRGYHSIGWWEVGISAGVARGRFVLPGGYFTLAGGIKKIAGAALVAAPGRSRTSR